MTIVNQHNLSRDIPRTVKRKVKKDSGFGCVICGSAICQYEHIDLAPARLHRVGMLRRNRRLVNGLPHDRIVRQHGGIYRC